MAKAPTDTASIFTKIINRELPATIRYEDDAFIAIDSISPVSPIHVLIIPKHPYRSLEEIAFDDIALQAKLFQVARVVAKQLGIQDSYKLFMNVGSQVQSVHHLHLHLTGGWKKTATREQLDELLLDLHNDGL